MKNLSIHSVFSSLILFTILALVFNFTLASIAISLILTYLIFNGLLDSYLFDSKLMRIVLTPFFYMLVLQCVVLFGWLLNRSFPLDSAAPLCALFLFIFYLYSRYCISRGKSRPFSARYNKINPSDYVALIIGVAVTLIVTIVPIMAGGFNKSSLLNLVDGNVDDSSHISFLNDRLQFNRGVLYHADIAGQTRSPAPYPVSWHAANAIVIKAINPSIKPGTQTLIAYIVSKVFWFFVMVFVFVKTVFILFKAFSKKNKPNLSTMTWLSISSLVFASIFLVDFFRDGFYSFFPQIISILLLGIAFWQINQVEQKGDNFYTTLPLIVLLAIIGSLAWLMVLPALLLALLVILLQRWKFVGLRGFWSEVFSNVVCYFPLYTLVLGAFFVQYHVLSADPASISFLQGILQTGGTPMYSYLMYGIALAGLVLSIVFINKRVTSRFNYLLMPIACILLLAFIVYALQLIHITQAAYYYYKLMSVVMALVIPIAIVGFALGFEKLSSKLNLSNVLWITVVIMLILIPQLSDRTSLRYLLGYRDISKSLNQSIYEQIERVSTISHYQDHTLTFYYIPGNFFPNEYATTMMKVTKPNSACYNTTRFVLNLRATYPAGANLIKNDCADKYTINLITDRADGTDLRKITEKAGLSQIITVDSHRDL